MSSTDKEIYQKIVEEQPYCQLCGCTNYLEIHHIMYRSQLGNNDERNLIRLCGNCHRLVHSDKKKWQPKLLEYQRKRYGDFSKNELLKHKLKGRKK